MIDVSLVSAFRELTGASQKLHEDIAVALENTSDELVEQESQKRRENTMKLREFLYKLDKEMSDLENLKRIVRISQGWNSVDIRSLESLYFELLRQRKQQNV